MSDHITKTRSTLVERRDELAPLVAEHAELETLIAAIGETPKATSKGRGRPKAATVVKAKAPKEPKAAKPKAEGASRGRKKGSGKRANEALEIITGQPGITIPEMAAKMNIKQNYLYRVLPGLAEAGQIVKDGKGWQPVGGASKAAEAPKVETHTSTETPPEGPVETAEEAKAREDQAAEVEFDAQVSSDPEPDDTEPEAVADADLEPETV